ncbi:drug exporter of the RND superfamily-like protein, partial [Reticulomyxa filosa]
QQQQQQQQQSTELVAAKQNDINEHKEEHDAHAHARAMDEKKSHHTRRRRRTESDPDNNNNNNVATTRGDDRIEEITQTDVHDEKEQSTTINNNNNNNNNNNDNDDDDDDDDDVFTPFSMDERYDLTSTLHLKYPRPNMFDKCYYQCGVYSTLFPVSVCIIILIYALMLPVALVSTSSKTQYNQNLELPRNGPHYDVKSDIQRAFYPGTISSWNVLIPNPLEEWVTNWTYVHDTAFIMKSIQSNLSETPWKIKYVDGVSVVSNTYLDTEVRYNSYITSEIYQTTIRNLVSQSKHESYFLLFTHADPFGVECKHVVNHLRNLLDRYCDGSYTPSNLTYDCYLKLVQTLPDCLFLSMLVEFVIAGVLFRSVLLPCRLLCTIVITLSFVFGVAVLIYQHGALDWLHLQMFQSEDGLAWIIPLVTVTLLLGLSVDYDFFFYGKFNEFVSNGENTRHAIVRAAYRTGTVITSAGAIMGLAFGALWFSSIEALNQAALIIVVEIFTDTFLVRTLLVPAMLSLTTNVVWHPTLRKKCCTYLARLGLSAEDDATNMTDAHDQEQVALLVPKT